MSKVKVQLLNWIKSEITIACIGLIKFYKTKNEDYVTLVFL